MKLSVSLLAHRVLILKDTSNEEHNGLIQMEFNILHYEEYGTIEDQRWAICWICIATAKGIIVSTEMGLGNQVKL